MQQTVQLDVVWMFIVILFEISHFLFPLSFSSPLTIRAGASSR